MAAIEAALEGLTNGTFGAARSDALDHALRQLDPHDRQESLKSLGEAAFNSGDFTAARDWFRSAAELRPNKPWRWIWLSRAHLKLGELAEACDAATLACELDPASPYANVQLVEVHRRWGNRELAAQGLEVALRSPDATPAQFEKMMRLAIDLVLPEQGTRAAERLQESRPNHDGAAGFLVVFHAMDGRLQAAKEATRALTPRAARCALRHVSRSEDPELMLLAAELATANGTADEEVLTIQRAALERLDDEDQVEVQKELGADAYRRQDYDAALLWFEAAAAAHPKQAWRWIWLSRAQQRVDDAPGALESAERAIELKPGWAPATLQAIEVLDAQGRWEDCLPHFDALIDGETEVDQLRKAVRRLYKREDFPRARRAAEAVLERDPGDDDARSVLAVCLWRLGEPAKAQEIAASARGPAGTRVRAQLELAMGSPVNAWTTVNESDAEGIDPRFIVSIGHALRRAGHLMTALEAYGLAIEKDPNDRIVLEALEGALGEFRVLDGTWKPTSRAPRPVAPTAGRVLHVIGRSFPHTLTGYTVRSHYVVRSQREVGIDARVATEYGYPWFDGASDAGTRERVDGVPYYRLRPRSVRIPPLDERLDRGIGALTGLVRRSRPSLLHAASDYRNALVALEAGRSCGLPVVYEVRGFWEETRLQQQGKGAMERESYLLHRQKELQAMHAADRIVTLGKVMKAELMERGIPERKITVVPNAVDVDRFQPRPPDPKLRLALGVEPGETVLGYISSFVSYEGIQYLIQATKHLIDAGHQVRTVLVGDGTERAALEAEAERLNVADRVVFTGRVPHKAVLEYYAAIDIFVVPRTNARVSHLVTPLKPFEAMAMERPLVVSDVAALREVVSDGRAGLTFQAEDPENLASVVEPLLKDEAFRRELGNGARKWVRANNSWAANGVRFRDLYSELGVL
jgi:PEP-CTERM/exosortase A-associated glycosyltransferase